MIKPDWKYNGTVLDGAKMTVSQGGTLGFFLRLECEDGEISHTIWLTPNTRERAMETFAILGVSEKKLQDAAFLENELARAIVGREVSFTTTEEEYKGKTRVKVGFINKRAGVAPGGSPAKAAAQFFGGIADRTGFVADDGDIPF